MTRLLLLAPLLLVGCGGGARGTAETTLATAARVVNAVDTSNARMMAANRETVVETATSREEAVQMLSPYWRVQESVDGTRALLFAAEASLDATGGDGLVAVASCIVQALLRLREAVTALEEATGAVVPIPEELDSVLVALSGYGAACGVEP